MLLTTTVWWNVWLPFACCKGGSGSTCLSSPAEPVSLFSAIVDGAILPCASGILFCWGRIMPAIFHHVNSGGMQLATSSVDAALEFLGRHREGVASHHTSGSFVLLQLGWCLRQSTRASLAPLQPPSNVPQDRMIRWRLGTKFHSLADIWPFKVRNLTLFLLEPKPYGGGEEHSRLPSSRLKWCNVEFLPGLGKQRRAKAYSIGQVFGKLS